MTSPAPREPMAPSESVLAALAQLDADPKLEGKGLSAAFARSFPDLRESWGRGSGIGGAWSATGSGTFRLWRLGLSRRATRRHAGCRVVRLADARTSASTAWYFWCPPRG
eukprot:COSAG02_NODE_99_length_37069_cov_24.910957_1_plen_110_part_00